MSMNDFSSLQNLICTEAESRQIAKITENRLRGREEETWGYVEVEGVGGGDYSKQEGGLKTRESKQSAVCFGGGLGSCVEVGHSSQSYGFHKPFTLR